MAFRRTKNNPEKEKYDKLRSIMLKITRPETIAKMRNYYAAFKTEKDPVEKFKYIRRIQGLFLDIYAPMLMLDDSLNPETIGTLIRETSAKAYPILLGQIINSPDKPIDNVERRSLLESSSWQSGLRIKECNLGHALGVSCDFMTDPKLNPESSFEHLANAINKLPPETFDEGPAAFLELRALIQRGNLRPDEFNRLFRLATATNGKWDIIASTLGVTEQEIKEITGQSQDYQDSLDCKEIDYISQHQKTFTCTEKPPYP